MTAVICYLIKVEKLWLIIKAQTNQTTTLLVSPEDVNLSISEGKKHFLPATCGWFLLLFYDSYFSSV